MTARPDDATLETDAQKDTAARPDRGQADDGKGQGQVHRGLPGSSQMGDGGAGINAQSGLPSGSETERTAPGISTDKKADDTK